MIVRIEKELCDPVSVNGYCEVPGPLYHIYKVDEDGNKEFVKTIEKDIREAAREAQRILDINLLEVAYKEKGPDAFSSVVPFPPSNVQIFESSPWKPSEEQMNGLAHAINLDVHPAYIIQWSSLSGDGWRVKHRMLRDNELPDCFWHIEIRLTDDPVILCKCGYEIYPRKFFGKVWIAQKIEYKRERTWEAIAEAVRQLKLKEKGII